MQRDGKIDNRPLAHSVSHAHTYTHKCGSPWCDDRPWKRAGLREAFSAEAGPGGEGVLLARPGWVKSVPRAPAKWLGGSGLAAGRHGDFKRQMAAYSRPRAPGEKKEERVTISSRRPGMGLFCSSLCL